MFGYVSKDFAGELFRGGEVCRCLIIASNSSSVTIIVCTCLSVKTTKSQLAVKGYLHYFSTITAK